MSELKEFKCPNCGGKIEFDTTTQKMKCPYCDKDEDTGIKNKVAIGLLNAIKSDSI